jgi:hypothetical protein
MSVSLWNTKKKEDKEFDIVIIGGGISGLSSAYWLQNSGMKIAIIEKNEIGSGATGRNAGFITCGSIEHFNKMVTKHGLEESLEIWKFSETNLKLLKEHIIKDKESEIGFENKGSFSLASELAEFEHLKKSAQLMKDNGIGVEVLSEQEVKSRLGVEKFIGGIKYLDDATVNPIALLDLIKESLNENITIFENHEVYEVIKSDECVVKTNKGDFKSSALVYALNGYSSTLDSFFKNKIDPAKAQVLSTEKVESFMEGSCYANSFLDYFRQATTGEFVIGGFRASDSSGDNHSDFINEDVDTKLQWFINEYIPKLKDVKVTHKWCGTMGLSFDGQPMVGSLPQAPNVYYLGGYYGHGLGLAFHCAKVMSEAMLEGKAIPPYISGKRA